VLDLATNSKSSIEKNIIERDHTALVSFFKQLAVIHVSIEFVEMKLFLFMSSRRLKTDEKIDASHYKSPRLTIPAESW
jgi:hypothetical protein